MFAVLIPIFLGLSSVLQGGLNKQLLGEIGLTRAVLINNLVLFLASLALFLWRPGPSATSGFPDSKLLALMVVPGLLGLTLVAGIPWALSKWGASLVFISLIGSQTVFSLIWDFFLENKPLDGRRLIAFVLGMASLIAMTGAKT